MRACLTREGALNTRRTSKTPRAGGVRRGDARQRSTSPRGGLKSPDRQRGGTLDAPRAIDRARCAHFLSDDCPSTVSRATTRKGPHVIVYELSASVVLDVCRVPLSRPPRSHDPGEGAQRSAPFHHDELPHPLTEEGRAPVIHANTVHTFALAPGAQRSSVAHRPRGWHPRRSQNPRGASTRARTRPWRETWRISNRRVSGTRGGARRVLRKHLAVAVRDRQESALEVVRVHARGVAVGGALEEASPVRAGAAAREGAVAEETSHRLPRHAPESKAQRAPSRHAVPVAGWRVDPVPTGGGAELAEGHRALAGAVLPETAEDDGETVARGPRVVRVARGTRAEVEHHPATYDVVPGGGARERPSRDGRGDARRATASMRPSTVASARSDDAPSDPSRRWRPRRGRRDGGGMRGSEPTPCETRIQENRLRRARGRTKHRAKPTARGREWSTRARGTRWTWSSSRSGCRRKFFNPGTPTPSPPPAPPTDVRAPPDSSPRASTDTRD